ncbi:ABC-F family ATP-binding cassette domain-containing protein [bacterium]|nr:ABC-F family ATP-binding cassette domain-containing protein [bacterium]
MVITFDNVSFKYIEKKILDRASFSITDSDKIGIVGLNGTGKTTILKLILGEEIPESGEIIKSGGMIINYLPQEPTFKKNMNIIDLIMEASSDEHKIEEYEVKSILSKLGLKDYTRTTQNMSGGEIKRLALAKALITYSDYLILDEPTNHLDVPIIMFLEKYLMKYKKGLIMVTHDRYFLQRVCNKILELDFAKTYLYDANYERFLELKEERLKLESFQKRKLENFLKREREWINRSAEARSTKQKGRINRYNELSKIEFNERENFAFSSIDTRLGKKLIEIKNGSKSFDKILFTNLNFNLKRTDIIGVSGLNGSGKSTFFKILLGISELDSGEITRGTTLNIGYLPQELSIMDPETRVIDYIEDIKKEIKTVDGQMSASAFLESFLFDKTQQYSKIKTLSGGEKRRLQIISMLIENPNILILDEPTNDLDLYSLELLEDYILNFKGPVLTVSHDRYFLDKICNKLLIFKNKKITESNMMYSEYLSEFGLEDDAEKEILTQIPKRKDKLPTSIRNEINKLGEEIPKIEEEIKNIKELLSKETTDYEKIISLTNTLNNLNSELDTKSTRYLELLEIKEQYN